MVVPIHMQGVTNISHRCTCTCTCTLNNYTFSPSPRILSMVWLLSVLGPGDSGCPSLPSSTRNSSPWFSDFSTSVRLSGYGWSSDSSSTSTCLCLDGLPSSLVILVMSETNQSQLHVVMWNHRLWGDQHSWPSLVALA